MLIAGDVYRPAAIDQLVILGQQVIIQIDTPYLTVVELISVVWRADGFRL